MESPVNSIPARCYYVSTIHFLASTAVRWTSDIGCRFPPRWRPCWRPMTRSRRLRGALASRSVVHLHPGERRRISQSTQQPEPVRLSRRLQARRGRQHTLRVWITLWVCSQPDSAGFCRPAEPEAFIFGRDRRFSEQGLGDRDRTLTPSAERAKNRLLPVAPAGQRVSNDEP
jgi:hypothetical protein